jgi:DNA polymerase-3 subunit chi
LIKASPRRKNRNIVRKKKTQIMTQVDFYILKQTGEWVRERFACKLTDKAYRLKHNVYIYAESRQQAAQMDDLLWTFKAGSFVPHGLSDQVDHQLTPVILGYGGQTAEQDDVMINLSDNIPEFFSQFNRVAEVVSGDEDSRANARERYKFYRERGYELTTHEIDS